MAQPHKGRRHHTSIRYPEPLHDVIEEHRAGSGYGNVNDYVVAMLQLAADAGLFPTPLAADQERLPISA
jgi:hypothetical protein